MEILSEIKISVEVAGYKSRLMWVNWSVEKRGEINWQFLNFCHKKTLTRKWFDLILVKF